MSTAKSYPKSYRGDFRDFDLGEAIDKAVQDAVIPKPEPVLEAMGLQMVPQDVVDGHAAMETVMDEHMRGQAVWLVQQLREILGPVARVLADEELVPAGEERGLYVERAIGEGGADDPKVIDDTVIRIRRGTDALAQQRFRLTLAVRDTKKAPDGSGQ